MVVYVVQKVFWNEHERVVAVFANERKALRFADNAPFDGADAIDVIEWDAASGLETRRGLVHSRSRHASAREG